MHVHIWSCYVLASRKSRNIQSYHIHLPLPAADFHCLAYTHSVSWLSSGSHSFKAHRELPIVASIFRCFLHMPLLHPLTWVSLYCVLLLLVTSHIATIFLSPFQLPLPTLTENFRLLLFLFFVQLLYSGVFTSSLIFGKHCFSFYLYSL